MTIASQVLVREVTPMAGVVQRPQLNTHSGAASELDDSAAALGTITI
jgi:hypothetical protein